jgi:hypothetical protein
VNGTLDTVDRDAANVVVALWLNGGTFDEYCTGILVTPTRILTANHCLTGTSSRPGGRAVQTVTVGTADAPPPAPATAPFGVAGSFKTVPYLAATYQGNGSDDVGIIEISDAFDSPSWRSILGLKLLRPSLIAPTDPARAAGFAGTTTTRKVIDYDPLQLNGAGYWEFIETANDRRWVEPGDSGGPLFTTRSNGARDVFGIISGNNCTGVGGVCVQADLPVHMRFANLTSTAVSNWLRSKLLRPVTQTWLSKHPPLNGVDWWQGEVEYTGACRTAEDADCDHWTDAHDNCPTQFNPSQADWDDDGLGDACTCPCDPANNYVDADGDGVCAVACAWQQADNCPLVANKDQKNCNKEWETANQQPVLGDACDPVPCPAASAAERAVFSNCTGNAQIGGWCYGRMLRDDIDWATVGAHRADRAYPQTPLEVEVPDVFTHMRFCQSNVFQGYDCANPTVMKNAQIALPESSQPAFPWHRVSMVTTNNVVDPRGAPYLINYPEKFQKRWAFASDAAYWGQLLPPPGNYPGCASPIYGGGTCLDGAFWTHAETDIGATRDWVGSDYVGLHGDDLSNHVMAMRPDATFSFHYTGKGQWRFILLRRTLPDPPLKWGWPQKQSAILVSDWNGASLGILREDGTAALLPEEGAGILASAALRPVLANTDLVWASRVEPTPFAGTARADLRAVALSPDGTAVEELAVDVGGVLATRQESEFPPFVSRGNPAPPPRKDFVTFYSAAAGGLFVLGGQDPLLGGARHDIWFRALGNDWGRIDSFEPDEVVDATFSYADMHLYVLDRTGGGSTARLTRLDMRSGRVEPLGQWSVGTSFERQWLTVDMDGAVLLATSSATQARVARLAISGGQAFAERIDVDEPALARAPVVDVGGYTLVGQEGDGTYRLYVSDQLRFGEPGSYSIQALFQ